MTDSLTPAAPSVQRSCAYSGSNSCISPSDTPFHAQLTANLREASYLTDGDGQFHVPFAASDTNIEVSRLLATVQVKRSELTRYLNPQLSRMIESARAQMEREGTLSTMDSTKIDDGLRYSMKVAW